MIKHGKLRIWKVVILVLVIFFLNCIFKSSLTQVNFKISGRLNQFIQRGIVLEGVTRVDQHPDYPTGCESVALYILLQYYGVDVTIEEIVDVLPKGPVPYYIENIRYGANPEKEFVGDPRDYYSYGVYNEPIAKVANVFKEGAVAKNGVSLNQIKRIIDTGNPVIVWTNIDFNRLESVVSGSWFDYETSEKIYWLKGEHAVVIYGYDEDNFYISNPYNGQYEVVAQEKFYYTYSNLQERVVYYS